MNNANTLINKYIRPNRGVIVDTNVMLVWIVGKYDREYLKKFNPTAKWSGHFDSIDWVVGKFAGKIVVTSHILAELSNFSLKIKGPRREPYFKTFVHFLSRMTEQHVCKDDILTCPWLPKIGITDLGIMKAALRYRSLVFTDDEVAASFMRYKKIDVLTLNLLITSMI